MSTSQFASLGLCAPIMRALADEGYDTPTPIQAQAIPHVLEGKDMLGCAQTGTGKTAAFALPILHRLHEAPIDKSRRGPAKARVLVLSPTRELATQIAQSFATYGNYLPISGTVIFGGVGQHRQVRDLQRGVDVIIATPGRLIDLMDQGHVDLSGIEVFILDEADRMLDMGFIHPIRRIEKALSRERQTLLFSATMPKEIIRLAESLLRDPVRVSVEPKQKTAARIEQHVYHVHTRTKQALLETLLRDGAIERAVVFTRTKHGADKVSRRLERAGHAADAIHGNKNQNQRQRALDGFKSGRSRVLVATDVAARGLDVDGVTHVFNYDMPVEPEAYVHRIGRTGRAGAAGIAISFCDGGEREHLRAIEKLTGKQLTPASGLPDGVEELAARYAAHAAAERTNSGTPSHRDHGGRRESERPERGEPHHAQRGPRPARPARPAHPVAVDRGPVAKSKDRSRSVVGMVAERRDDRARPAPRPIERVEPTRPERSEQRPAAARSQRPSPAPARAAGPAQATRPAGINSRGRGKSRPGR